MVQAIHDETQLVDSRTRTPVHSALGMFVLVMMSHGDTGTIIAKEGNEHKHIKLVDIYRLLSPKNFPAMKGKPKMVILQACSGGLLNRMFLSLAHFMLVLCPWTLESTSVVDMVLFLCWYSVWIINSNWGLNLTVRWFNFFNWHVVVII